MKRKLVFTVGLVLVFFAWCGEPLAAQERDTIVRRGMGVLGGWATLNISAGAVGLATTDDATLRGFWEMNALWNTVNLALAGGTLIAESRRSDPTSTIALSLPTYRLESHRFEKILIFNAGLDLAYMTAGAWMWERGQRGYGLPASDISPDRLTGWGQSLVVQGAFLFVFDVVLARAIAQDRRSVTPGYTR
jgi:hypothetical protein